MQAKWIEYAEVQQIHVFENPQPLLDSGRFWEVGIILLRDAKGSILPFFSFDRPSRAAGVTVMPSHVLNSADYETLLAASSGLCRMAQTPGIYTFDFAIQKEGTEYVLLDVSEEADDVARNAFRLRRLSLKRVISALETDEGLSTLGVVPQPTSVGVIVGEQFFNGDFLGEVLTALPDDWRTEANLGDFYLNMLGESV